MSACRGGTLLLTYANKRGEGGQKSENFADIICERSLTIEQRCYTLFPSKICTPLNFAPLIFAPLIFAHSHIPHPFNFRAPLYYCKFAVFLFIRGIFSPLLIFALSCCANLLSLNFAQARCAKFKGREF